MPRALSQDPEFRAAVQEAAANLFCSHFTAMQNERDRDGGDASPEAQFKALLSQWSQSLSLLQVLIKHAALEDADAQASGNVRKLRAKSTDDEFEDGEDDEGQGGRSSGGGPMNKAAYNPMSFFAKKGV
jgi:hypothetical protein